MERGNGGPGKDGFPGGKQNAKVMFQSLETDITENISLIGASRNNASGRSGAAMLGQLTDIAVSLYAFSSVVPLSQLSNTNSYGYVVMFLVFILMGLAVGSFFRSGSRALNN